LVLDHWYDYAKDAALNDHLLPIILTSQAEGAMQSTGWPYGEGKSTLAMILEKKFYMDFCGYDEWTAEQMVRDNFGYTWGHYRKVIRKGMYEQRVVAYVQDDLQEIAGKDLSHNKGIQWTAKTLTTKRPYLGIFIATATQLGDLAAAWRKPWMFEFKVYERGKYEVQFIKTKTKFSDPENPYKLLDLKNVPPVLGDFPKLSGELWEWYTSFRHEFNIQNFEEGWAKHFGKDDSPLEVPPILTKTKFENLIRSYGVKGNNDNIRKAYDEIYEPLIEYIKTLT